MVFQSLIRLGRNPLWRQWAGMKKKSPDEFWKKRKVFKLAAHFIGRRRNCYSLAVRAVQRGLQHLQKGRIEKKRDMAELWEQRITAGCSEHGPMHYSLFRRGLTRCNILLNRRILSDLACWEPRTFKALTDISKARCREDLIPGSHKFEKPDHVRTRGLMQIVKK